MTPTVQYRPDTFMEWTFGKNRRSHNGADSIVIKHEDLPATTATDLARALRKSREHGHEPESILIDQAPKDEYDPKYTLVEPVSFILLDDGRLAIDVSLVGDEYIESDDSLHGALLPLIEPILSRNGAEIAHFRVDSERSTAPFVHQATIVAPTRSKTLEWFYRLAESAITLFGASQFGYVTRDTVGDLILGGRADLLVGLREGPWFDAKSCHYDIATRHGKISLAQAASRFCNSEEGGIVTVGLKTKAIPGGEVVKSINPVPIDGKTPRQYRQVIENSLFPFPDGLKVDAVETSPGHGLVVISIPPQAEELKPFLVHGAIVSGKSEGSFISIVRRSGEDSIPITAQQIHTTLAAGRALLRRGHLPRGHQLEEGP